MVRSLPEPDRSAARRPSTDADVPWSRSMAWVIFSELHIPAEYQRRVLLFGVLGVR
jgi:hypothetical protein